jgi:myo-inositol-1(or 4)-monophosphatase
VSTRSDLDLAISAAIDGGTFLRQMNMEEVAVSSSEGRDVKLTADTDAEQVILKALRRASDHPILSEEAGGLNHPGRGDFWVVDPLDGSANFVRQVPLTCVSLSLVQHGEPTLGVTYDFARDEIFSAVVGDAAWLGTAMEPKHSTIHVSSITDAADAYLATGLPVARDYGMESLLQFATDLGRFKKVRMFGSAALSLAYVASGRLDAYAEDDIMLWDVAAGVALVRGAGGHVSVESSQRVRWGVRIRAASRSMIWSKESKD